MPTITLAVSDELKKEMDRSREINWSEVARQAIRQKLDELKMFNELVKNSRLTEKDALELGRKINRSMHKKYSEKM